METSIRIDGEQLRVTVAAADLETDPFSLEYSLFGHRLQPFMASLSLPDGDMTWDGEDAVGDFLDYLVDYPDSLLIYMHNGGGFDFHFLLDAGLLENAWYIGRIGGRIVEIGWGQHVLRDSARIYPVALKKIGAKKGIDIELMARVNRDAHMDEIREYCIADSVVLREACERFIEKYGPAITVGSAAMKEFTKHYKNWSHLQPDEDELIRPYYYGGRVSTFQQGIIEGELVYLDVNSLYPDVMCSHRYPMFDSVEQVCLNEVDTATGERRDGLPYVATVRAIPRGCFCRRVASGLVFDDDGEERVYHTTSHEIQTALRHGLVEITEWVVVYGGTDPALHSDFAGYIDHYTDLKVRADTAMRAAKPGTDAHAVASGEREIFKLFQNIVYGKMGQNPENFLDTQVVSVDSSLDGWEVVGGRGDKLIVKQVIPEDEREDWRADLKYNNVLIASLITGAARAKLLDGIMAASTVGDVLYCDTDSVIVSLHRARLPSDSGMDLHKSRRGAWDIEDTGDKIAIAGKKLYALRTVGGECKIAAKGVSGLTMDQIESIAAGDTYIYRRVAPTFTLDGRQRYLSRRVRATGRVEKAPQGRKSTG